MLNPVADRTIAICISYIGTRFCGFARQEGLPTVQGEVESALRTIFRRDIETVCAGRTDTGVHARGQVVSADLCSEELDSRTVRSLARSIDALTDDDICVRKVVEVPYGFSARFDADWREYRYRLADGSHRPLFSRDFTWWVASSGSLDVDAMREASGYLVGEHDFKSFCVAASAEGKSTVRDVRSLELYEESVLGEDGLVLRIVGSAFLHSMVRTIAGTLVEVGSGRREPAWVAEVLDARDRRAAGPNAPAEGLVFWHVRYKGSDPSIEELNGEWW